MKRFLPLIILILAPLSLLLAKPSQAQNTTSSPSADITIPSPASSYESYIAQPGDSLWALAETKVPESEYKTMVINAVKNLEIMLNNLDDTNYYLEIDQSYKLLTQSQISYLTDQINSSMPTSAAYLIANPAPVPNWAELRQTAQSLFPNIAIPPNIVNIPSVTEKTIPTTDTEVIYEEPSPFSPDIPTVQGAHTSIIPLADSPFPY